ncbi:MAG: NAD(P)-dependent glycerol-3-phosphate dehydrogenase [Planctomycetes bacterium]|nr:NAD(P)-dependent glycerol-3-phosphate dehydrogenase [Planctomycetota bacterium]
MLTKATVVGAGAMGTICAQILANNGVNVALLVRRPEVVDELRSYRENRRYLLGTRLDARILPTIEARSAFRNTEFVLSAIPCQHMRGVWEPIATAVPAGVPICSVTKGIETGSLKLPSQILRAYLPAHPIAVLSGPSIAPEVARCLPATVVAACSQPDVAQFVQQALSTSWFRIYTNPDVLGVELAGALKNVIAIAAGILDGLRAGDNANAALLTRGLVEITRLGVAMGALPQTFMGLAGIGDLVTTCVSPLGRNRTAGQKIGSGATAEEVEKSSVSVVEGIPTTKAVLALAQRMGVEMPITRAVADVLFSGKPALTAITELMNRPLKAEERF